MLTSGQLPPLEPLYTPTDKSRQRAEYQAQGRYSDPGSWAHHFPGLKAEGRPGEEHGEQFPPQPYCFRTATAFTLPCLPFACTPATDESQIPPLQPSFRMLTLLVLVAILGLCRKLKRQTVLCVAAQSQPPRYSDPGSWAEFYGGFRGGYRSQGDLSRGKKSL